MSIFSIRAAWQHIEPDCTFDYCLSFRAKKIIWLPHLILSALLELLYILMLMPFAYLMLWHRLIREWQEARRE